MEAIPNYFLLENLADSLHFTPDSKWIVYSTVGKEKYEIIKTDIDGTKQIPLATHKTIYGIDVSPDGSQIAYVSEDLGYIYRHID